MAEHTPDGPTEEHLVEELAGIIWRKRRLRMAEAAVFREKLRHDATAYNGSDHVAGAALLPVMGDANGRANVPQALVATPANTAGDLRDVKRDQGMTQRAWNILEAGGPEAYQRALLRCGTIRALPGRNTSSDRSDGCIPCTPSAEALKVWIGHNWNDWYEQPIAELQHRDAIGTEALGMAYAADYLDVPARYEVHLDRKLERMLTMLIRLRELRRATVPE